MTKKPNLSVLSLAKAQQQAIFAPIILENVPYLALVNCGTMDTLISSIIIKDLLAKIIPQKGTITSYQGLTEE